MIENDVVQLIHQTRQLKRRMEALTEELTATDNTDGAATVTLLWMDGGR